MMTKVYKYQSLSFGVDRNSGKTFSNIVFQGCEFKGGAFSVADSPELRSTARNMKFLNCSVRGSSVDTGIIEDVLVENLKTYGLFQIWMSAFKHVKIQGHIGRIMISYHVPPIAGWTTEVDQAFENANKKYYENVDWALDISQAEFRECDIRGLPVNLVRRDPETQVIVTRKKAIEGAWQEIYLDDTHWREAIEFFLEREDPATILVAPKRANNFRNLLEGLNRLRDAGVAESY